MKQLIINSEDLRKALKKLGQAVPAKTNLPVLSNLLLKASPSRAEMITTDLELTISFSCSVQCNDSFEALLPFDFLSKLVSLVGIQPMIFQLTGKNRGTIIVGDDRYQLGALTNIDDYPKLPTIPEKNSIELDGDFMTWLERAMATISKDELRPAMTRVLLELGDQGITIVSTNAHALFKYVFAKEGISKKDEILISPKVARALDGFKNISLKWRADHVALTAENITVIATRHTERFPDYRVVLPKTLPNLTLNRQDLIGTLSRVALCNADQMSIKTDDHESQRLRFSTADVTGELRSDVLMNGEFSSVLPEVGIAPVLFKSILGQVPFAEIRLHIESSNKGILITSEEDANYTGLIMPLLLNQ